MKVYSVRYRDDYYVVIADVPDHAAELVRKMRGESVGDVYEPTEAAVLLVGTGDHVHGTLIDGR